MAITALFVGAIALAQDYDYDKEITRVVAECDISVNPTVLQIGQTTAFVIEGYMYPVGTLDASNGINPDGTPEFPDQIIGHWTCQGWGGLARSPAQANPIVAGSATKQTFEFDLENFGNDMLITQGFEIRNVGPINTRAVVGGTGAFSDNEGLVQLQDIVGINAVGGPNYRQTIVKVVRIIFKNKNGEAAEQE